MESADAYTVSQAHPESMDYLSSAWCNFAVQTLQGNSQAEKSVVLVPDPLPSAKFQSVKGPRFDEEVEIVPPWQSNDLKSWIWMQQALHPEINYKTYFDRKSWFSWKANPFKNGIKPFKKWLEDMKQKRKEESRLKRAEVHGAVSVAGLAAALAVIAAENSKDYGKMSKESVMASAAALVASQCAEMAQAMGATREQLRTVLSSAATATSTSDILTFTAAASTSVKAADTLKVRKERSLALCVHERCQAEDENDFDFEHGRFLLSKGAVINIETSDGEFTEAWVSVYLNSKSQVVAVTKRLRKTFVRKTFSGKNECVVQDLQVELYSDPEDSYTTCYLIVLTTNRGTIKLDMSNDYPRYKMWMSTLKHMLMMHLSLGKMI